MSEGGREGGRESESERERERGVEADRVRVRTPRNRKEKQKEKQKNSKTHRQMHSNRETQGIKTSGCSPFRPLPLTLPLPTYYHCH